MHVNTENSNYTMSYNILLSLLSLATGNSPYFARYPGKLCLLCFAVQEKEQIQKKKTHRKNQQDASV